MIIMIKAMLIDFGNVVAEFDHMKTSRNLAQFTRFNPEEIHEFIFESSGLERLYDIGEITSADFYRMITHGLTMRRELTMERFAEIWGNVFTPNPKLEEIFQLLPSDIRLVLLSNTNEWDWSYISQLPVVKKYFGEEERLTLSFREGCRKPDPRFFQAGIRRCGCHIQEIFFIDDIPEYVEAFKGLGGNGMAWNCQTDRVETLIAALQSHGGI